MIDRVVDTGEAVHTDGAPARPADETDPRRSSWYPVRDDNGVTTAVAVFVADDSARQEAEQALRDSRARTGKLLEVAEELAQAVTVSEVVAAVTAIGRRTVGADWSSCRSAWTRRAGPGAGRERAELGDRDPFPMAARGCDPDGGVCPDGVAAVHRVPCRARAGVR